MPPQEIGELVEAGYLPESGPKKPRGAAPVVVHEPDDPIPQFLLRFDLSREVDGPCIGADDEDVSQIPAANPELPQGISKEEPAGQRKEGAGHPEKGKKGIVGHLDVKKEGKAGHDHGPDGRGLENVEELDPEGGEAPGIVKPEGGKNDVPQKKDPAEEREIPQLDPHRKEFEKVDVGFGVCDRQCRGEKGANHDQQVKERIYPDEDLPVILDQLLQSPVDGLGDVVAALVEDHPDEVPAVLNDLVSQVFRNGLAGLFRLQDENHPVHVAGQGDTVGRCGGRGGIDQDEVEQLPCFFPEILYFRGVENVGRGRGRRGGRIDV